MRCTLGAVGAPTSRTKGELATVVAVVLATFLAGAALIAGVPTVFALYALGADSSLGRAAWAALAVGWVGIVLYAVIRDREARGWIALILVGWLAVVPAAARLAVRLVTGAARR